MSRFECGDYILCSHPSPITRNECLLPRVSPFHRRARTHNNDYGKSQSYTHTFYDPHLACYLCLLRIMSRQCDFVAISAKGRMRKKRRFVFGQNDNSALETYSRRQQPLDVASCHSLFRWHMATWNRLPMWYSSMLFFFSWQFSYSVDWTEMDRVWCSLYMFIRHVGTVNVNNINGNINIEQCMADLLSSSYRLNTYNAFIAYDVGRFCTICRFFFLHTTHTYNVDGVRWWGFTTQTSPENVSTMKNILCVVCVFYISSSWVAPNWMKRLQPQHQRKRMLTILRIWFTCTAPHT